MQGKELSILALIFVGVLWARSRQKPTEAKVAAPEEAQPLTKEAIEATTAQFWGGMDVVEKLAVTGELTTKATIEARVAAYLAYPINRKDVPADASVEAKVLASAADAVKAGEAQALAGESPYTIEWWTITEQYAKANNLTIDEAYQRRTGEVPSPELSSKLADAGVEYPVAAPAPELAYEPPPEPAYEPPPPPPPPVETYMDYPPDYWSPF